MNGMTLATFPIDTRGLEESVWRDHIGRIWTVNDRGMIDCLSSDSAELGASGPFVRIDQ